MAIVKQGSVTLNSGSKGDKGDAGVGGGISPNEIVIETEADLYNVANANKIFLLQSDIALTANRTLPDNVILKGDGGKITGAYILTLSNTGFISDNKDTVIIDNNVVLDFNGTNNSRYDVYLSWFGAVRHTEIADFDNKIVFDNALIAAKNATLFINKGHYKKSPVLEEVFTVPRPSNTLYGAGSRMIGVSKTESRITVLPEPTITEDNNNNAFVVYECENGSIEDLWIEGDLETASEITNEHRHGINFGNFSFGFTVKNCKISNFTGDGIYSKPWGDVNGDVLEFSDGDIDDETGLDISSSSHQQRSAYKEYSPQVDEIREGALTAGGMAGYDSLVDYSFSIFFYKNSGADFMGVVKNMMTYKTVELPETCTGYRVVISRTAGDVAPTSLQFRGQRPSKRVRVINNEITRCYRNGISNLARESVIMYNWFHHNGGRVGGPSYDIDLEDGYQELSDVTIAYNTFENTVGGSITLKWCRTVHIIGNKFQGNKTLTGQLDNINARETWGSIITQNFFYGATISAGRQSIVSENQLFNSTINLAGSESRAKNNIVFNGSIKNTENNKPARSISEGNTIYVQRPQKGVAGYATQLTSLNDTYVLENNMDLHKSWFQEPTEETGEDAIPRSFENLIIHGEHIPSATKGMWIAYQAIKNSVLNMPLSLVGGRAGSFTLTGNKYTGYIQFGGDYDTGVSRNINIIGGTLDTSAVYGSGGYSALRTRNINENLYFEDFTINATDKLADSIIVLKHGGTTVFKDCTISNDTDALNVTTSTCPSIHFVDCTMPTTTTVRAIDKIRFTKPHPDLPIYADNATAIADDYNVDGDVYRTATGEYKIVYTP